MLGLLIEVKPYADESLLGYLCRLAEANAIDIATVIGLFKERSGENDSLAAMITASIPWSGIAAELAIPHTCPAPLWNIRRRRFCSKCLEEAMYWRAEWDLSLVTVCGRHRLQLRDICPHCRAVPHWVGPAVAYCSFCGQSLASNLQSSIAADSHELWMSKELVRRMTGSLRHCDRHLKHLGLEEFHELAFRIGCFVSRAAVKKPKKVADSDSLAIARPIARAAACALDDWPIGFFWALDHIQAERRHPAEWKLAKAIGPIYRDIFVGLPGSKYEFVRDAFNLYLTKSWQGPLALRHKRLHPKAIQEHPWLPIHEAATRLCLDPSLVARLIETKQVPSRIYQYPSGRTGRVVDMTVLERITPALRHVVTVEGAAQMLGLTKQRVLQLIRAGLLAVWGGTPKQGMRWYIDQASIQAILTRASTVPSIGAVADLQVTLRNLLRFHVNGADQFVEIVSALLSREGILVGRLGGTGKMPQWVVDVQALESIFGSAPCGTGSDLSIIQLSKDLGMKQEVAYALVRHGLIKSRRVVIGKRPCQVVRYGTVAAFRRHYALGVELATCLGMSPKAVLGYLRDKDIHPVAGPTLAERLCRQYVWRRTKKLAALVGRSQHTNVGRKQNAT